MNYIDKKEGLDSKKVINKTGAKGKEKKNSVLKKENRVEDSTANTPATNGTKLLKPLDTAILKIKERKLDSSKKTAQTVARELCELLEMGITDLVFKDVFYYLCDNFNDSCPGFLLRLNQLSYTIGIQHIYKVKKLVLEKCLDMLKQEGMNENDLRLPMLKEFVDNSYRYIDNPISQLLKKYQKDDKSVPEAIEKRYAILIYLRYSIGFELESHNINMPNALYIPIVKYFSEKDSRAKEKFEREFMPEVISGYGRHYFRQLLYLREGLPEKIKNQEKEITSLKEELETVRILLKAKCDDVAIKKKQIDKLEEHILELDKEKEVLSVALDRAKALTEHEEKMANLKVKDFKLAFVDDLKENLRPDIEGLQVISNGLDDRNRTRVNRRLQRIERTLSIMEGME